MLTNNFCLFALLLSYASTPVFAQSNEPQLAPTPIEELSSENKSESTIEKNIFLSFEIKRENHSNWQEITDVIQNLLKAVNPQTHATTIIPHIQELLEIAERQKLKPSLGIVPMLGSSQHHDLSSHIPADINDSSLIEIIYIIKIVDKNHHVWKAITHNLITIMLGLSNKKTVKEKDAKEIIASMLTLLADQNNNLTGELFIKIT